ncbi:MAG: insulinase family protein [Rickettsiales bacterium]|jgi:predicted Zn-dependent peptidase|nr:insulinase family protein [Rickettsiales bacterium]
MKFSPSLYILSNGAAAILDPMEHLETASMAVAFQTGGRDESADNAGITHFMEHMLMKGTPSRPSPRHVRDFAENSGGTINASTGNSTIRIYGRVIAENLSALAGLVADCVENPLMDEAAIENEKRVILDEIRRSGDDPNVRFFYFTAKNIFAGSGYANETLGTEDAVKSFSRRQLLDWKARRLSARNCVIAISGKIGDQDAVVENLEKLFGALPGHAVPANSANEYTPSFAHNPRPDKNVRIRLAFEDKTPFGLEYRFKNMCSARFGAALSDRLHDVVRNGRGLAYRVSGDWFGNEAAGADVITTGTAPEHAAETVALIARTAADMMRREPFGAAELERWNKRNLLGDADWLESQNSRRNKLIDFYFDYGKLYDYYEVNGISDGITAADVVENTRDAFDGALSVITQGADCRDDLRQVWADNFK